jgi:Na+-driven multidrug efflux pump
VTTLLAHIASAKWPALNPVQPVRRMLPTLGTVRRRAAPRALEGTTHPAAKRSVDSQLLSIAGPALAGLCIDPLATLVDTVWASRLGTPELAALGAAGSLFALCAKTFNFVLPSTTSAVAAASSAAPGRDRGLQAGNATSFYIPAVIDVAYSSLLLALLIGVPVGLAMVRASERRLRGTM